MATHYRPIYFLMRYIVLKTIFISADAVSIASRAFVTYWLGWLFLGLPPYASISITFSAGNHKVFSYILYHCTLGPASHILWVSLLAWPISLRPSLNFTPFLGGNPFLFRERTLGHEFVSPGHSGARLV